MTLTSLLLRRRFNLHSSTPYIKAEASVRHFAPHALALTSKYAGTVFQGNLQADFQGHNIENMEGLISLNDFCMSTSEENYTLGPICFKATNEPGKRNLSLHSDFLHAEMGGRFQARHVNRPQPETAPCLYPVFRQNTPT